MKIPKNVTLQKKFHCINFLKALVAKAIVDEEGKYRINYNPRSSTYVIASVLVKGEHVQGSPFKIQVKAIADSQFTTVVGKGISSVQVNEIAEFVVTPMSKYGTVSAVNPSDLKIEIKDNNGKSTCNIPSIFFY